jgi:hypothetical protein
MTNFWAYVCWDRRSELPAQEPLPPAGDLSAPVYFDQRDTHGKAGGTRHPRLARAALRGKRKLNLQIREWAAGYENVGGPLWMAEARADFPWLPSWVWKAVERQR